MTTTADRLEELLTRFHESKKAANTDAYVKAMVDLLEALDTFIASLPAELTKDIKDEQ